MKKFVEIRKDKRSYEDLQNQLLQKEHDIFVLTNEKADLKQKLVELKNLYEEKIDSMTKNINQLIAKEKESLKNQIEFYQNDFYLLPKKLMDKKPFLKYMSDYYIRKIVDPQYQNFCYLIYFLHPRSYRVIRHFLPVLPGSLVRSKTFGVRQSLKSKLTNIEQIPLILKDLYKNSNSLHVTIAGDAASIKPISEKGNTAVYTFMIVPLKKMYSIKKKWISSGISGYHITILF